MKHLTTIKKGLLLALCVLLGGANVWGEGKTITLENIGNSLTSTSNTSILQTSILTKEDGSNFTLNYLQGKKYNSSILLAKNTGAFISNNTPVPGVITSVEVFINSGASKSATYHCAFNTQECTTAYTTGSTAINITGGNSHEFSCSVSDAKYFCVSLGNANNGQVLSLVIHYVEDGAVFVPAPTFTIPSGACTSAQTVKVENHSASYTYYYTTNGTEPSADNGTVYNHTNGIEISSSCTLKMIAIDGDGNTSSVSSAKYTLPIVYESLEELAAADLTTGTLVTVSFTDMPIKDIYVTNAGYRNGVYFDIQKDGNDIEIYFENVPASWVKEGKLSGTITGTWKLYNSVTWELVPESGWKWDNLTYTAVAAKKEASIEMENKTTLVIGKSDTYTVTYTGDGVLTVESSDQSVATASIVGATVTITPVAKGKTTITISAPSTTKYYAVEKSYDLYVSAPLTPAANGYESVDFTKIEPYCSIQSEYVKVENYAGSSFNMVFAKPQDSSNPTRYYKNGTAVRAYTGNTITITAAEEIQAVKVNYTSGNEDVGEKVTGLGTKEVVITSSTTCRFTSIDVYYKGVTLSAKDGSDYYATFSSDKAVQFVNATVYTVVVKGSALEFNEVASKQVPANEGVLIKTTGTKAAYIEIDKASTLEYHNLAASSIPMKDSGYKYYKLAYGDWEKKTGLGFYWGAENGAAFTPKAGGAYLLVPAETAVKGFAFGGDIETAIEGVETEAAQAEIFDLSGRKVSKAVKGLYIINGKKVVK